MSSSVLDSLVADERFVVSFVRALFHYATHKLFIRENQALDDLDKITHLPLVIVQGQKDKNTPSDQAVTLHKRWKNSRLYLVEQAGHSSSHMDLKTQLRKATSEFYYHLTLTP